MFPLGESKFWIDLMVRCELGRSKVEQGTHYVSFYRVLSSLLFHSCKIILTPSPPRKLAMCQSDSVISQEVASLQLFPCQTQDIYKWRIYYLKLVFPTWILGLFPYPLVFRKIMTCFLIYSWILITDLIYIDSI